MMKQQNLNKRITLIDDDPITNMINTKIITSSTDFLITAYTNAQATRLYNILSRNR